MRQRNKIEEGKLEGGVRQNGGIKNRKIGRDEGDAR